MKTNATIKVKSETGTTIQIRRGLEADLPGEAAEGEFLFCLDSHKLFSGMGAGNVIAPITHAGDATSIVGVPVDPTPPSDGEILIYDHATGKYIPADPIVSGPDAPGVAPTRPPVQIGAIDPSGNVQRVQLSAAKELTTSDAGLGTDGATPPVVSGTGVRGWLRAIYEKLLAGLSISGNVNATVTNFPATQPVSAAALPLPAGASTSALQTTGNTSLASLDTKAPTVGQKTMAGSVPVALASDQPALPVTAAALPLPAGASTSALQTTGNTSLASVDTKTPTVGQKAMAGSVPVTLATDQPTTPNSAETGTVFNGITPLVPKFAPIVVSASGATTVLAAVGGKRLRVLAVFLNAAAAVNAKWQSHVAGDITGLAYLAANGGYVKPFSPVGWFQTAVGEALDLNLSAGVAVGGELTYVEV